MLTVDELADELRRALPGLYDPTYAPPPRVLEQLGQARASVTLQERLLAEIESLRPGPDVPRTARIRRLFDVLHMRYVEQWTQRRVADDLGITVRHLAREQARAITFLADRLLKSTGALPSVEHPPRTEPEERHEALRESLASLEHGPGQSMADLGSALRRAKGLVDIVAKSHDVEIGLGQVSPGVIVAVRQTVLVPILVRALTHLMAHADGGEVRAEASGNEGLARIVITASSQVGDPPTDDDLSAELVRAQRGAIAYAQLDPGARISITLPLVPKRLVLVIDDNPDLIHYYGQCVANAPYRVVGVTEPERAVSQAIALEPDLIVLDLMMPDVDGYDVLEQLQAQPSLAGVPIIISSVISEQELALALGATLCLIKPVRRAAFLAGLDAAVRAGGQKPHA